MRRAAGAIAGADPLRHDVLAAERARVLVDDSAVFGESLVEHHAVVLEPHQAGEAPLAVLDRLVADPAVVRERPKPNLVIYIKTSAR